MNSTVQGSAADLVKLAMVNIDKELMTAFPDTRYCHRHSFQPRGIGGHFFCLSISVVHNDIFFFLLSIMTSYFFFFFSLVQLCRGSVPSSSIFSCLGRLPPPLFSYDARSGFCTILLHLILSWPSPSSLVQL